MSMQFDPRLGEVIGGYRLDSVLKHGGMGTVYRATHVELDKQFAVKVIRSHLADDPAGRERFKREAKELAKLEHPNVVLVTDAGEQDGLLYLVTSYIDGEDLEALIDRMGHLEPAQAVSYLRQIASALDAAAEKGLVHRDVKPSNIMIQRAGRGGTGRAYLTDFGIVKNLANASGLTQRGDFIGTYHYSSPEQIKGEAWTAGRISTR